MERKLKFRAWNETHKIMHHNFQFIKSGDEGNDWIVFTSDKQKLTDKPHPLENPYFSQQLKIMQFTGLHDKNGKEIYSDDIISDGEYKYRVYAMYGGFAIKAPYWSPTLNDMGIGDDLIMQPLSDAQTMSFVSGSCEIIGNLYENPELIESK